MLKIKFKFLSLIGFSIFGLLTLAPVASASAHLAGGDFMQAFNKISRQGTWTDPISAKPGEIVEFRITAKNDGDQPAEHVQVWGSTSGQVPQGPASQLVITGKIATVSSGGNEETDTAMVNIQGGSAEGLRYLPGAARLNGVTDKFNCPNICNIGDEVLGGIDVGTIQPGDFVEVTFEATVTNTPVSTPTPPACVSNNSCSASTPSTCGQTNSGVDNCGNTCTRSSAACTPEQHQEQNQTINITNPTPTPAPAVTTLPKTGLPNLAWSVLAFIPAGLGMRRFRKVKKTPADGAQSIWNSRRFKAGS